MKRGYTGNTYRSQDRDLTQSPWGDWTAIVPLPFVAVRSMPLHRQMISICLYHQPDKRKLSSMGDGFRRRYLRDLDAVIEFLAHHQIGLVIFCDEAMQETALQFQSAAVYRITTPPSFPFSQHLWRYYAALLPDQPLAWHYRGADNIITPENELPLFTTFLAHERDVIRAPYIRSSSERYMPIRGSCSTAREGTKALAWWLSTAPTFTEPDNWPDIWHNDEIQLGQWIDQCGPYLNQMILLDREMPPAFYATELQSILTHQPATIVRL